MAHTLLVSSFPDPLATNRVVTAPDSEESYQDDVPSEVTHVKRAKHLALLGVSSDICDKSAGATTYNDSEDDTPESPMIFRSFEDGGYGRLPARNHNSAARPDRNMISPSAHRYLTPEHVTGSGKVPLSTKESIAVLGLSRRRPSPDYRFLHGSLTYGGDSQSLFAPPRSSSLPASPMPSAPSSRAHSPAPSVLVDKGDVSEIVFADRSIMEPQSDLRRFPPSLSLSLSHLSPSPATSRSSSPSFASAITHHSNASRTLRSKTSTLSLLSDSPDSRASSAKPKKTSFPPAPEADLFPYSLMVTGALGMQHPTIMPDLWRKSKPTPKPVKAAEVESPASANKSFTLSLKRVKFLRPRRALSISSVPVGFSPPPDAQPDKRSGLEKVDDPAASTVTLVAASDEQAVSGGSPAAGNSERSELAKDGDVVESDMKEKDSGTLRITTHRVVGDVWEEQDVHEVIPILRSLRFSGV